MSNLFKMHMEDRTSDMPEGVLITEGDEGESVAATIQELTTESAEVEGAECEMEEVADDAETLEEVEEAIAEAPKTEAYGLNESNARLLTVLLRSVGGSAYPKSFMPKMENFGDRHNRGHATQLTMEGVAETLKSFWEALKAAFNKTMAKIKSWGIKTFSAARKLKEKATKIRDKANSTAATVDNKTFKFSQAKLIHMDGKLKDVAGFKAALSKVSTLVDNANQVISTNAIDELEKGIESIVDLGDAKGEDADKKLIKNIDDNMDKVMAAFNKVSPSLTDTVSDTKIAEAYGKENTLKSSGELPGGKQLIYVSNDKNVRVSRLVFDGVKKTPRDVPSDMEVQTLNNSEIAAFAEIIIDSVEDIIETENKWEKVDKARDRIVKSIDRVFKDVISDLDQDAEDTSKTERELRKASNLATTTVSNATKIAPMINSYAISVYGATLNWCEGSARNHKA